MLQRRCAPQQLRWVANYAESGLTVAGVFSDDDLKARDTSNNADRGVVAHEIIQKANDSWIREYGIPPAVDGGEWHYADMVKNKEIYEIKPEHGEEDAVGQATNYVRLANEVDPGHKLASAGINRNPDPLLTKDLTILSPVSGSHDDTHELRLNYWKARDGEILYRWVINNTSAEERAKARRSAKSKRKRAEEKQEKQKKESAKIQKGQAFTLASWAKKSEPAKKPAPPVKESPSATAEPIEAPEAEEEAPEAVEPEAEEPVAAEEESTS